MQAGGHYLLLVWLLVGASSCYTVTPYNSIRQGRVPARNPGNDHASHGGSACDCQHGRMLVKKEMRIKTALLCHVHPQEWQRLASGTALGGVGRKASYKWLEKAGCYRFCKWRAGNMISNIKYSYLLTQQFILNSPWNLSQGIHRSKK